jgi:peptide/nickel transport system permease protein
MADKAGRRSVIPRKIIRGLCILLVSGLLGALLIRVAPGYGTDEQELDARISQRTRDALSAGRQDRNLFAFYVSYFGGLVRGDAGDSIVFRQPVAKLVGERAGTTTYEVATALALGWMAALTLGTTAALSKRAPIVLFSTVTTSSLLSVPSAVIATVCLLFYLPPSIAIAAVVFPRIFPHIYEQFREALTKSHVLMARAKGMTEGRVFLFHILPTALPPVLALAGVSVSVAMGASIPVEVLSDVPGLGQLAWRAALGRDLPVLVAVTLILTSATVIANLVFEIVIERAAR